jgi:hypothetical protein
MESRRDASFVLWGLKVGIERETGSLNAGKALDTGVGRLLYKDEILGAVVRWHTQDGARQGSEAGCGLDPICQSVSHHRQRPSRG